MSHLTISATKFSGSDDLVASTGGGADDGGGCRRRRQSCEDQGERYEIGGGWHCSEYYANDRSIDQSLSQLYGIRVQFKRGMK